MDLSETQPAAVAGDMIPPSLTEDKFLGGRIVALQPEKGFRAGIDSVLLAAAVRCEAGDSVLEAGAGTGVAALCLAARVRGVHITGVELAARNIMIADANIARNHLQDRIRVLRGDFRDLIHRDRSLPSLQQGSFTHGFANPPYFETGKHQASPNPLKAAAHAFEPGDLAIWIKAMQHMLTRNGVFTLIHLPESLPQILSAMDGRFGAIVVAPIFARPGSMANRMVIQAVKGARAPLRLHPGLTLTDSGNQFTPDAEAILRGAAAWPLS